jgi:hypothetical protein
MEALQVYPRTAGVNDLGNPVRDAVADGGRLYLPGVTADGSPQRGLLLHLIIVL